MSNRVLLWAHVEGFDDAAGFRCIGSGCARFPHWRAVRHKRCAGNRRCDRMAVAAGQGLALVEPVTQNTFDILLLNKVYYRVSMIDVHVAFDYLEPNLYKCGTCALNSKIIPVQGTTGGTVVNRIGPY